VALIDVLTMAVAQHLDMAEVDIDPDVDLMTDLGLDSLDLLEVAEAVESRIGVEVPSSVWDSASKLSTLAETLEAALTGMGMSR
jgi:acyl carrier protein